MPQLTDDEKSRLFMTLDAQTKQLEKLETGMYGDTKLGIKGLIQDMEYVKGWISKQKRKIAFVTGIFTVIGFFVTRGWEYFINKK